ncbi:pilin [Luteibacter aegosomaticola]|uniref:pilin n=1 Tax=Luteibacter aegosomaticola TaxID=2911538 RepID=UPI001FFB6B66|nr:pilin [Luteibacter aegosomaticola]UPG91873.1 pilin [Luteibacter aegosomaticola]
MIARRTVLLSAAISAALGLAACHKSDEAPKADPQAVAAAQTALSAPAWLRQHLPAQTVAYVRIPSPWGMLNAVPNGRPLDAALSAKAHLDAIAKVRDAIAKDKLLADLKAAPLLNLLLGDLRSTVEVAVVDPLGIPSPASHGLITAVLDFPSIAAFNARLASLSPDEPLLAAPLDAQGNGRTANGMGVVHYDLAQHRLWIALSIGKAPMDNAALAAQVADIAKATAATAPPLLAPLEARIDTTGEGLFGWIAMRGVGAVAAAQAGDSPLGKLPADFASKADAIAFGAGTVNGRGQFQILVHAPQARALQYLAPTSFAPNIKTVGEPHWAFTLALPTDAAWKTFEGNLNLDFGPDGARKYQEGMASIQKKFHFDPRQYMAWFGPESIAFADDAGLYFAIRMRDLKAWHAYIEQNKVNGWKAGTATVDGTEVHWLQIPGQSAKDLPADTTPAMRSFMQVVDRFGGRTWWTEEGDWVVTAKVPQALSDRAAAGPDTSLDEWLKARSYPGQRTFAGFTATTHGAQRDAYYFYLSMLQFIAGAAGSDADISTLPSAHTLGLPDKGVVGAALEMDTETVGLSLTYEQSPMELISQGSGASVMAVTAILAAIAVPQYQEYTIRSQVSAAETEMEGVKTAVAEHRLTTGKFPATNAAAGLDEPETLGGDYLNSIAIGPGGQIVGSFSQIPPHKANVKLDGGQLILTPVVDGKQITWRCSAEAIEPKYLPVACRDEPIGP